MEDGTSPAPGAPLPRGGTVEPANRAAIAKERFQTPAESASQRYELRDPFADVTYRAKTLPEMIAKADQLGTHRFIEIARDGQRSTVEKVDGQWQRGPQRPAAPQRPDALATTRDEVPDAGKVDKTPSPAAPTAKVKQPAPEAEARTPAAAAIAKIDAQAERAGRVAVLESALKERYLIKRAPVAVGDVPLGKTEYRFRGDPTRVAFTESTFKLATDTNSPSVARSMVDVAEARNWKALRVSGHEDFRRMVWLEASVRGVKTLGYEPNPADLDVLRREREARMVNRIEPAPEAAKDTAAAPTEKGAGRGGGGRKAVLAAVEAVLVARKVPASQREAVMAAAAEQLSQRVRSGQDLKVKVYDPAARPQRTNPTLQPEVQRAPDRATPAPVR